MFATDRSNLYHRPEMARQIGIANQKGGVGKTTTAVNLSCGLARRLGAGRVLLIDVDPQANATHVLLGVEVAAGPRRADAPTMREVLSGDVSAENALRTIDLDGATLTDGTHLPPTQLHVLPSHLELATLEPILTSQFRGEYQLKRALDAIADNYDIIIVDCPPSLGSLTLNALLFCEEVIIPVNPGEFALVGLGLLQSTIQQAREANPRLYITGILPNGMKRTRLSRETHEALRQHFGRIVLPPVPERVAIGEAHSSGGDIFEYAPASDGAAAYHDVITSLLAQ